MKKTQLLRQSLAWAVGYGLTLGTTPLGAQQSQAPSVPQVDEAFTWFTLEDAPHEGQHPSNDGWRLSANFRVFGAIAQDSALKMTVKQGRRVLGSARCSVSNTPEGPGMWASRCGGAERDWGASAPRETATGEYDVELRYVNGQTDQETLLRTFRVRVAMVTRVTEGNFRPMANRYYVDADHRLLDSAVRMVAAGGAGYFYDRESRINSDKNMVEWISVISPRDLGASFTSSTTSLRCSVDGAALIIGSDQAVGVTGARSWAVATRAAGQERAEEPYDWRQVSFRLPLTWGPPDRRAPGHAVLDEHNGQWSCELRQSGQTLRVIRFTVANGRIAAHPEESAGLSLAADAHFAESYLTNAAVAMERPYQLAAFRAGGFYGRAWASAEARRFAQNATRPPAIAAVSAAGGTALSATTPVASPTSAASAIRYDDGYALFRTADHIEPVGGRPTNQGWSLIATARVTQELPARSAFRFVTKRGGRVVGELRCDATINTQAGEAISWVQDCGNFPNAVVGSPMRVNEDGEFVVEVHVVNGQTDQDTLVRTHRVLVNTATGVRAAGAPDAVRYYISLNAQLAATLIERVPKESSPNPNPQERTSVGSNDVWLHFWASVPENGSPFVDLGNTWRCTVNGQPLALSNTRAQAMQTHRITAVHTSGRGPNPQRTIIDYRYFAMRLPLTWGAQNMRDQSSAVLEEHPGAYQCDWRANGQTLRTFRFTVNADATIAPHAEQLAGLSLGPQTSLVDTALGASPQDVQTGPAELRAGSFFGRAWSTPAGRSMATAFAAIGAPALAH
jgi:hypothetical protein